MLVITRTVHTATHTHTHTHTILGSVYAPALKSKYNFVSVFPMLTNARFGMVVNGLFWRKRRGGRGR